MTDTPNDRLSQRWCAKSRRQARFLVQNAVPETISEINGSEEFSHEQVLVVFHLEGHWWLSHLRCLGSTQILSAPDFFVVTKRLLTQGVS